MSGSVVAKVRFRDYRASVSAALEAIHAPGVLPGEGLIIVKPNLTTAGAPPVTTPPALVEAIIDYVRGHSGAEVAIGEGCGNGITADVYRGLGYDDLAARLGVKLIDFNTEPSVRLTRSDTLVHREFHLPKIAVDAFIISAPVLKDHSFTGTTIALKNMFGLAPGPKYRGGWNKSKLHSPSTDRSVVDCCLYKSPGLSVVDAVVALEGMHLSGTERRLGLILAGVDPVAVDAVGSELMGHDPRDLEYLALADGRLGTIDGIEVIER